MFVNISDLLSSGDVASQLNCTSRYVVMLAKNGAIAHYKFGKMLRFSQEAVDAYKAKNFHGVFEQPKKADPLRMAMGQF